MNGLADLGWSRAGKKENKGETDSVELGMLELSRRLDLHRPFSITDGPEKWGTVDSDRTVTFMHYGFLV